jgi:hypothetical protein
MAEPVYILCSESGADDKLTGQVSLFNLTEKVHVMKLPPGQIPPIPSTFRLRVTALWMRGDDDCGGEFESEIRLLMPPDGEILAIPQPAFTFPLLFQRVQIQILGPLPVKGPGIMRVQSRIRRNGTEDWLTQQCPIILEEVEPPQNQAAVEPNPSAN